VKTYVIQLTLC